MLRDGASGQILVPKVYKDVVVLPALSSYERQGNTLVYQVNNDSLIAQSIQVIAEAGNLYAVEGIKEGTAILGKGVNKVRPGTKIKPIPTSMDSIINSFNTVFK